MESIYIFALSVKILKKTDDFLACNENSKAYFV